MVYRIAICDDSATDAGFVEKMLNRWAKQRDLEISVQRFPSAEAFLFRYAEEKSWDILLLDIEMGQIDGVELAKLIRKENETVQIVFITGFADYIAEGYDVAALHYLMKPLAEDKFFAVMDKAVRMMEKTERVLLLPVDGEMIRLPLRQIFYVEAFGHCVLIATEKETMEIKRPLSEIERQLGDGFIHCHRSYLVGLAHIARLSKKEVILDSGKALPLSRTAAAAVHKAFVSYYMEGQNEAI